MSKFNPNGMQLRATLPNVEELLGVSCPGPWCNIPEVLYASVKWYIENEWYCPTVDQIYWPLWQHDEDLDATIKDRNNPEASYNDRQAARIKTQNRLKQLGKRLKNTEGYETARLTEYYYDPNKFDIDGKGRKKMAPFYRKLPNKQLYMKLAITSTKNPSRLPAYGLYVSPPWLTPDILITARLALDRNHVDVCAIGQDIREFNAEQAGKVDNHLSQSLLISVGGESMESLHKRYKGSLKFVSEQMAMLMQKQEESSKRSESLFNDLLNEIKELKEKKNGDNGTAAS